MSGGASCPSPSYGLIELENKKPSEKEIKRIIRKQVTKTLAKILGDALIEDKRDDNLKISMHKQPVEERLDDSVQFYGFLTNSLSKESDIILGARIEYFSDGDLVFYRVPNKNLFTKFPAPGIYQGPYTTNKKVFVEVLAKTPDHFICRPITQLRYLELMSMKGE
jgi:hypothetical protein